MPTYVTLLKYADVRECPLGGGAVRSAREADRLSQGPRGLPGKGSRGGSASL